MKVEAIHGKSGCAVTSKLLPFIDYHHPRLARNGKVTVSDEYSTDLFARDDDRATLYARLMSGDVEFLSRLGRDTILKAKTEKLLEFFQVIQKDLDISSSNPFYEKLEIIKTMVRE